MASESRTYGHFCLLARALEQVGDRWSLLVVRDLLSGRKRFTDLADRLGGITPKVLTRRLRDLQEADIVRADRISGRREVWYELTEAGEELRPVLDALAGWSLRHAWRPPQPGEPLHIEHLLGACVQAIRQGAEHTGAEHTGADREPVGWRFDFGSHGAYLIHGVPEDLRLTAEPPAASGAARISAAGAAAPAVDVTVSGPAGAWAAFATEPSESRAAELGFTLTGTSAARARFLHLLGLFPRSLPPRESAEPLRKQERAEQPSRADHTSGPGWAGGG